MTRAREAARLIGNNTFRLDSNNAVGFNSTTPDAMFDINHGLTVAGVSTFTGNVTMSGDLTVQGTTTTLDTVVQEVDLMNIQANASVPGLGVTQSGSGAIIAAYDGTSEVFTVDSSGRSLIQTNSSITSEPGEAHTPSLQVAHPQGNVTNLGISVSRFQASNPNSVPIILQKSRNDTIGSHTIVVDDDELGRLEFAGSDGSNFRTAAAITGEVDGSPGSSDMPGRLEFKTTADGASSPTERLRITSTGGVHFNNAELIERVNIVADKLSAVPNVSLDNGMVHYYTSNETTTANPNIVSSAGINTNMATGDTMSVTILSKPNNAGYFPRISIDGRLAGITTYWSGGSAPSSAESSGVDVNVYQIIKTGSETFDVLANTSNFA